MAQIGFVQASDPRYVATVERIGQELKRGDSFTDMWFGTISASRRRPS